MISSGRPTIIVERRGKCPGHMISHDQSRMHWLYLNLCVIICSSLFSSHSSIFHIHLTQEELFFCRGNCLVIGYSSLLSWMKWLGLYRKRHVHGHIGWPKTDGTSFNSFHSLVCGMKRGAEQKKKCGGEKWAKMSLTFQHTTFVCSLPPLPLCPLFSFPIQRMGGGGEAMENGWCPHPPTAWDDQFSWPYGCVSRVATSGKTSEEKKQLVNLKGSSFIFNMLWLEASHDKTSINIKKRFKKMPHQTKSKITLLAQLPKNFKWEALEWDIVGLQPFSCVKKNMAKCKYFLWFN